MICGGCVNVIMCVVMVVDFVVKFDIDVVVKIVKVDLV